MKVLEMVTLALGFVAVFLTLLVFFTQVMLWMAG